MKVTALRWTRFRLPFRTPYATAHGVSTHRSGVILRLRTDAGLEGLGEASLDPSAPEAGVTAILDCLRAAAPALVGSAVDAPDRLLVSLLDGDDAARATRFAVDTALHDARGRAAGRPLAALLTPAYRPALAVNATIAAASTEAAVAAARAVRAAGFGTVKLKVGLEATVSAELARVRAVRAAIGPDVKLRLDANGAWAEATAIGTVRALAACDIELIEQPVLGDLAALARVRAAVATPIGADEDVVGPDSARAILASAAADLLVLKPMRLGGIDVTRAVAAAAAAAGASVIVTTTIDTGIATAAALQVAATVADGGRAHGLATASLLEADLLRAPLPVAGGVMRLPAGPGLGVALDEAELGRYAVDEGSVP